MNPKNESNKSKNPNSLLEMFLNGNEKAYELASENEIYFKELTQVEESVHFAIRNANAKYLDSLIDNDSPLMEALDIDKSNKFISETKNVPLPLYLKNYLEADFSIKEEDRLVIRFGKAGMKLLGSFFNQSLVTPLELTIPAVRNNSINNIPQSISMLEKTDQGSLVYQVIQENENEAYLSVKFDSSSVALYNQVNLRKDNRFIYSSNISAEGLVSFSGLKEGLYNIEFTGKNVSKRFDLSLFADKM